MAQYKSKMPFQVEAFQWSRHSAFSLGLCVWGKREALLGFHFEITDTNDLSIRDPYGQYQQVVSDDYIVRDCAEGFLVKNRCEFEARYELTSAGSRRNEANITEESVRNLTTLVCNISEEHRSHVKKALSEYGAAHIEDLEDEDYTRFYKDLVAIQKGVFRPCFAVFGAGRMDCPNAH